MGVLGGGAEGEGVGFAGLAVLEEGVDLVVFWGRGVAGGGEEVEELDGMLSAHTPGLQLRDGS